MGDNSHDLINTSFSINATIAPDSEVEFTDETGTENERYVANIVYALCAIIGIPGNLFVLLAIFCFRDMRTISNIYIFNLAVADMVSLLGAPFIVVQSFKRTWIFGEIMCKLYLSSNGLSQFASAAFIGVLSFDRYLAVCRPVQATEWRTYRFAMIISCVAWLMVIMEMTPLALFSRLYPGNDSPAQICVIMWGGFWESSTNETTQIEQEKKVFNDMILARQVFAAYVFALSYLLPLTAVWIFYANIIRRMWARRKQIWGRKKSMKRTTFRVSILGLAIVISYTLCWMPFWFVQLAIAADLVPYNKWLIRINLAAYALQYFNSAANPFLYVFLSDAFRRNVSQLLRAPSSYKYRKPRSAAVGEDRGEAMLFVKSTRTDSSTLIDNEDVTVREL